MPMVPVVKLWLVVITCGNDDWGSLDWHKMAWLLLAWVGLPRTHWVVWLVVYGLLLVGCCWVDGDLFSVVAPVGVVTVDWWFL